MIFHDILRTFMRLAFFYTLDFDSYGDFRGRILDHLRSLAEVIESRQASSLDMWRVLVIAVASNKMAGIIFWCTGIALQALHCIAKAPYCVHRHCYSMIFQDPVISHRIVRYFVIFCDILLWSIIFYRIFYDIL